VRALSLLLVPLVAACPLGPRPCFDDDQCEDGDVCVGAVESAPGQCLGPDDPLPDGGVPRVRVNAESVEVGGAFACGVSTDGDLFCVGGGSNGQLGVADPPRFNAFNDPIVFADGAVDVAVADDHGCAIFDDGTVRCWGSSTGGRLGVPVGVEPGTLVEPNLPAGVAEDALEIDGGFTDICLRTVNEVWCWGPGVPGYTPGDPQRIDAFAGASSLELNEAAICAIVNAEVRCLDALTGVDCTDSGTHEQCTVDFDFDASAQLTCESDTTTVRCAGDNDFGVVDPTAPGTDLTGLQVVTQGASPQVGTQMACAIGPTDEVVCWGRNLFGSTGQEELFGEVCVNGNARCQVPTAVPNTDGVRQFDLRRLSGCAVKDDGDVVCWGEFLNQTVQPPTPFSVFR
jgi:hypothetical protein